MFQTYLAIECTHSVISVALKTPENTVVETDNSFKRAAETLLPLIQKILSDQEKSLKAIDAIFLSSGPGSFTALRIGMSVAKGLAMAIDKPLILIPTLESLWLAACEHISKSTIVPVIHSKAEEFYTIDISETNHSDKLPLNYAYKTRAEIVSMCRTYAKPCCITGRNLSRFFPEMADHSLETITWLEADFFYAQSLLVPGIKRINENQLDDLATASPLYLKEFEAKISKKQPFLKNYFK